MASLLYYGMIRQGGARNQKSEVPEKRSFSGTMKWSFGLELLYLGLLEYRLVCLCGLEDAISGAGADVVLLQVLSDELDGDGAPAVVGILLRDSS